MRCRLCVGNEYRGKVRGENMGYDLLRLTPSARKICSGKGNLRRHSQVSPGTRPWDGLHPPSLADTRVRDWPLSPRRYTPLDKPHKEVLAC